MSYEGRILLELDVFMCQICVMSYIDMTLTHIITLNYAIFTKYKRCLCPYPCFIAYELTKIYDQICIIDQTYQFC